MGYGVKLIDLKEYFLIETDDWHPLHIVPDDTETGMVFYQGERFPIILNHSKKLNYLGYILVRSKGWKVFIPYLPTEDDLKPYLDMYDNYVGNIPWVGMGGGGSPPYKGISITIGTFTE
ncbi:MAG: hypothetical protein KA146_01655 [Leptospiraceae bacterium]|nr:hypothetical protein [Leptospiraceae bacterium]